MALTEEQIQIVKQGLAGSFWNDVVVPTLAQRGNSALRILKLFPNEREGDSAKMTDDELRAQIREAEYLLSVFKNEVTVYEMNRRREELAAEENGANLRT